MCLEGVHTLSIVYIVGDARVLCVREMFWKGSCVECIGGMCVCVLRGGGSSCVVFEMVWRFRVFYM